MANVTNQSDFVQRVTNSTLAGWLSCVLVIGGCYWYLEGALREMHNIKDAIEATAKLEKLRDKSWKEDDDRSDKAVETLHLAIRKDQEAILSKLSENNGIMQGTQNTVGSIMPAIVTIGHALGVHQGHHGNDLVRPTK